MYLGGGDELKTYIWGSLLRGLLRSFLVRAVLTSHEILGKSLSLSAFPVCKVRFIGLDLCFQTVVPGTAVLASPGNLLDMQILIP